MGPLWFATHIPAEHEPASRGHALIIPYRHVEEIHLCTPEEWTVLERVIFAVKERLKSDDPTIAGFNFGANLGTAAGQSIPHLHFHLIPRRAGDSSEPIGIRNALRRCLTPVP